MHPYYNKSRRIDLYMNRFHLDKHIRRKSTFGGTLTTDSAAKTDLVIEQETKELTPLSQDSDPRVKKLKKELEKLSITPK